MAIIVLAAGLLAGTGSLPLRAARGTATDWVTLGKSKQHLALIVVQRARRGLQAGFDAAYGAFEAAESEDQAAVGHRVEE